MSKPDKQDFLSIYPVFRKAPAELVEAIVRRGETLPLKEGGRMYDLNGPCNHIGFPLAGEVRVFRRSESGREITLYAVVPGEICILSVASILSGRPYPAESSITEQGRALVLSARNFLELVNTFEAMRSYVFGMYSDRLWATIELVEEVTFRRLDQRLSEYLVEKAENNLLEMTHQTIAQDLGSSREVISRLLKDFRDKGLISGNRGRIRLLGLAP